MTDAELVALAIARVGSTARLADLMWIESRNLRRYASGEKPLSPVKRVKLEALVADPEATDYEHALQVARDYLYAEDVPQSSSVPAEGTVSKDADYETGYRDGESSMAADYHFAMTEGPAGLPNDADVSPSALSALIASLQSSSVSALNGPEGGGMNGGDGDGGGSGSGSGGANVSV